MRWMVNCAAVVSMILMTACGGGGGGAETAPPAANASVGGLWRSSAGNVQGSVLVTEDGRVFGSSVNLTNNCVVLTYGSVTTSGTAFTGATVGTIAQVSVGTVLPECTLPDGSQSAVSVLSGSFEPRTSMTLTSTATTSLGLPLGSSTATLRFDPLYRVPSSLAAVAGSWTGPTGNAVTISAGGVLSAFDPGSGCLLRGQVLVIDPAYNAYSVTGSISGCGASALILNGASVRALMMIDNSVTPHRLVVGQENTLLNGTKLVAVSVSTR
jgi:hypothetical protein